MNIGQLAATSVLFLTVATGATAESGLYFGVTGGISNVTSDTGSFGPEESTASLATVGGIVGYRKDTGNGFFGGELNAEFSGGKAFEDSTGGQSCSDGADGPYYCTHNSTLRLRGIAGITNANGSEFFGTLGVVSVQGESAVGPVTVESVTSTGVTAGVGMTLPNLVPWANARVELVVDSAENSNNPGGYEPGYNAASFIFGLIF